MPGVKAAILIGGLQKGTRFRPLSLDIPKPFFPVGGYPLIYHHIEALQNVPGMTEIILIGFFQQNTHLNDFLGRTKTEFKVPIRYLPEYCPLGTAGGIYHFRDMLFYGSEDLLIVMNADCYWDYDFQGLLDFHKNVAVPSNGMMTILATEAIKSQSMNYGCIVTNANSELVHFVEKPETFVSSLINGGVYVLSKSFVSFASDVLADRRQQSLDHEQHVHDNGALTNGACGASLSFEKELLPRLAGRGAARVLTTTRFWSQMKTAGAAIYANRHILGKYHRDHPDRLAGGDRGDSQRPLCKLVGDLVSIHPTAIVDPTATLGPNVSVGPRVVIGPGARVRESIILDGASLKENCCVLYSIVGWGAIIGAWTRVEGTPNDPNPNKAFAKLEVQPLFSANGCLNPSVTQIGANVVIGPELIILNSIVLPDKELVQDCKNQIVL